MKYLSLFSGIGGFELGIQKAYEYNTKCKYICPKSSPEECSQGGVGSPDESEVLLCDSDRTAPLCIGYSEIDKYAIQVYNKHFNHKNYGDATKIDTRQLPDFDLLVGGFPCQAFSIAGKRRGFDEARGTLFFDIARILADKKPRNFILENVKGLLSHDGGATFTTIIRILSSMGYFVEWQVLNAKNFGVPQNRERVFIVGHLGGQPIRKVFPIGECDQRIDGANEETSQANISRTVDARTGAYPKWGQYIKQLKGGSQGDRVYDPSGISVTLASQAGGKGAKTGLYAVLTPDRLEKRQNGRRFKEDGEPSFTITKTDIHGVSDGMRIRRLTPKECERLMGYPDGWTAEGTQGKISDTQRYRQCGNGIVSNVVREVVSRLYM